jgi:hypothetical protein
VGSSLLRQGNFPELLSTAFNQDNLLQEKILSDQSTSKNTTLSDAVINTLTTKGIADRPRDIKKPDMSHLFNVEIINGIVENAIDDKSISIENLCLVLAYSGDFYNDYLQWLWDRYGLDDTGQEFDVSTDERRYEVWEILFELWRCKQFGSWEYTAAHNKGKRTLLDLDSVKICRDVKPIEDQYNKPGQFKFDIIEFEKLKAHFNKLEIEPPQDLFPIPGAGPTIRKRIFPELDYDKLVTAAQKWIDKYPFINRISLYKNPSYKEGGRDKYLLTCETQEYSEFCETHENYEFNGHFLEGPDSGCELEKDLKDVYQRQELVPPNLKKLWRPTTSQPGEPLFHEEYPEPFNTMSGISERTPHWVLFDLATVETMSTVNEIVVAAKAEGFIRIEDLVMFFSDKVSFTDKHLPILLGKFDCEKERGAIGPLSNRGWRVKIWMMLIYRIVFGILINRPKSDVLSASRFRKLIQKYKYENGDYRPADLCYFEQNGYDNCFLNIDEVREYLVNYAGLPSEDLPGPLFSSVTSETIIGPEPESVGYCASQKKRCRAAVTEIITARKRKGGGPLSSGEWYERPDLREFQTQKKGGRIKERAFYEWITDLVNPDKKPGPIKGTKRTKKVYQTNL